MQSYRRFRLRAGARGGRRYERVSSRISIYYTLLNQVCTVAL